MKMNSLKTFASIFCLSASAVFIASCNSHTHAYSELNAEVPATCVESGKKAYYTCGGCDKIFDENYNETTEEALLISPKGHSLVVVSETESTSCQDCGHETYFVCEDCEWMFSDSQGENRIYEIPTKDPLGHDLVIVNLGEEGHREECQTEGCTYVGEIVPHTLGEYTANNDATLVSAETESTKCENCDYEHSRVKENGELPVIDFSLGEEQYEKNGVTLERVTDSGNIDSSWVMTRDGLFSQWIDGPGKLLYKTYREGTEDWIYRLTMPKINFNLYPTFKGTVKVYNWGTSCAYANTLEEVKNASRWSSDITSGTNEISAYLMDDGTSKTVFWKLDLGGTKLIQRITDEEIINGEKSIEFYNITNGDSRILLENLTVTRAIHEHDYADGSGDCIDRLAVCECGDSRENPISIDFTKNRYGAQIVDAPDWFVNAYYKVEEKSIEYKCAAGDYSYSFALPKVNFKNVAHVSFGVNFITWENNTANLTSINGVSSTIGYGQNQGTMTLDYENGSLAVVVNASGVQISSTVTDEGILNGSKSLLVGNSLSSGDLRLIISNPTFGE